MNVLLTGATGLIGSAVLSRLVSEGHQVTAIVRSAAKAAVVESAGASAVVGDLIDTGVLGAAAAHADGVIHTASPGDASSADFDDAVVATVVTALTGSGKPYVHTGGAWVFGAGNDITEARPMNPPQLTAWRPSLEQRVLHAEGVRSSIVAPGIVYGGGQGIIRLLIDGPTSGEQPGLHLIGDGTQHWITVHVDDLAALYVLALESSDDGSYFIGASGRNPTVRELGEAASAAAGLGGRVIEESAEETRNRLGALLADALMIDQEATGSLARTVLGWEPNSTSLIDELATRAYAPENQV